MLHLGLGSFFRAHQAWYTDRAEDDWGIAAFSGRRPELAQALQAQGGLYTLITRSPDADRFDVIESLSRAHPAANQEAWLSYFGSPEVRVVTVTVTEAGYVRGADGRLDTQAVAADIAALRGDPAAPVASAPARLVAGLLRRRAEDAGPMTLLPCDNLPHNGTALRTVVREFAALVDPSLGDWIAGTVDVASTMVDRITPEPTDADRQAVLEATGGDDPCAVATEPFSEWAIAGAFPGGRPAWESAGAVVTDDVTPFEQRKLLLLNGAHSLMAYLGLARGHATVAGAVADPECRRRVEQWWDICAPRLPFDAQQLAAYRAALLERWANPRIRHTLTQIATDGSQKLPVRFVPVLRAERARGELPEAAVIALAGWVAYLRRCGDEVRDVRVRELSELSAGELNDAVPRLIAVLDKALADDTEIVAAVRSAAHDLER
jgi:fructuronate reductase